MELTILQCILLLLSGVLTFVVTQDPCSASMYTELGDLAKRNPNYVMDSVPLCDRYIDQKWYRARLHRMPTTSPSLGMCGTTYPYWMDDSPPEPGQTGAMKVCQVGFSGPCSKQHTIRVKNCGNFFVYELTPLDVCNSAYCFEPSQTDPGTDCVSRVPSNITVAYHSVSWTSKTTGTQTVHEPDVKLVCQFQKLSDKNFYYDITWYVDDTEVVRNQTISSNSSDVALLSGTQMLAKGKKANSMISCVVGAKFNIGESPCQTNASSLFFAGIKVLTPTLRITRGQSAEVELQFTIPFINENGIFNTPGQQINDQTPLYIQMAVYNSSSSVCDDLNKNACNKEILAYKFNESEKYNTDEWKVIHKIKVQNKHDGDFKLIDKHITLRLETRSTSGTGSKIWENIFLPDIQVYIEDTDSAWKGKSCESHTDPHMKTFDGKYYECQLDGTFILYRNQIYQQEVQEKHHMCHPDLSYPRCTCGVAVRSGKDVFIVDICNTQTVISFPYCEDKVLKVIKTTDKFYKVIFPTGTLVEIKFVSWPNQNNWHLNIDIFPSPSDVRNSSGLCGILDNNYRNDFTWNNPEKTEDNPDLYSYSNHPDGFSNSWKVQNGEVDLFDNSVYDNLNSITTVFDRVCTCKKRDDNPREGDIDCSYGNYKDCKFTFGKKYYCILNPEGHLRRKRDLRHLQSLTVIDLRKNEAEQKNRAKRQTNTDVMSLENATTICNEAFQASDSYLMCQEHVSDLANTSVVNCISDVMMTGVVNITKIHIEAALEQCSTFVVLNSTFQEVKPDITYRIESLCENNCSGNGICNTGNCTCNNGYAGSDCSFDVTGPPSITHISDFGICDKSSESCDEITLYGRYFLENMNTTCFVGRKTLEKDGSILSETNYETSLQERTLFEGYCPLDYNTDYHWVTAFRFNISNDGSRFTENYNVYTYQSLCQELKNETGNITFLFKDGYCYINNTCVAAGDSNKDNLCDVCNISNNKYQWSFNTGHCFIDGNCFTSGSINGTNPCSVCNPSLNITAWSPNQGFCFIGAICYFDGQINPYNDCDICQSNISKNEWSFNEGFCLIGDTCVVDGGTNSTNPCQFCNVSASQLSWSKNPDCLSTETPTLESKTTQVSTAKPTTTVLSTSTAEPTTMVPKTSTAEPTTTVQTTGTAEPTPTMQKTSIAEPTTTQTSTAEPIITGQTKSTAESTTTVRTTEKTTTSKTTEDRTTSPSCVDMSIENITVTYHNVSWNTSIKLEGPTNRTVHNPSVNLKCNFASALDNLLFYKVEWYVNNHTLVKTEVRRGTSVKHAILSLNDLFSMNKKAGIKILCKVGAMKDQLMTPCKMSESGPFLAGMMMNGTKYSIARKGKAQIGFYLTVPFVTQTVILNETKQALRSLEIHSNIIPMSENSCGGSIGVDQCFVKIDAFSYDEKRKYESDEWRKVHYITVYHIDTDAYSIDTTATLHFKTIENEDGFFHNISLENIVITIFEVAETWKGKSCGSKTDPHLYTFDRVPFESHIAGEFVLYRNMQFNQEVQTRHEQCHINYPFPRCTCAVSVQSGRDIFMIDICDNKIFIDFLRCQDNSMQVYKTTDKVYKIFLPTGTSVVVSLVKWPAEGFWQIDIDIYPSLADVNNTAGLCGTLDGDGGNDFTHRNGTKDSSSLEYPDDFSRSWIVQDDENLFNSAPSDRPPISSSLDQICTCSPSGNQCSYQTFSRCSKATGKQYYCTHTTNEQQSLRKKRGVHLNSNLPSTLHERPHLDRQKRQQSKYIFVTTEARAENVCKSAFNNSEPFQTCEEYISDMTNASLSNCIMDLRLTGDENITSIHIEAALQQCINFLDLNTTLKTEQPDVTYRLHSFCANNCSSHGICKKGNCACDVGYGGSDCSFDVRAPPTILSISPNGTCDISSRTCSEVLLDGRYFLENINKTCFITTQLVYHNDTIVDTTDTERPLDDRTLSQGACPLPEDSRATWITKYTFKVTYDGKQFTQTYPIYKYQSECQQISYDKDVEMFTLKAEYCFIDNTCVRKEASNPTNSCEVCSPSSQKYDWSLHQDCVSTTLPPTTTKNSLPSQAFIIAVSVASIFVVAIVVLILVWRCGSYSKQHHSEDSSTKGLNVAPWRKYFDEGEKFKNFSIPRGRRYSDQK